MMLEVEKWADEISAICKKYTGEDWFFRFDATEDGYDFHGFVGIAEQESDNEKDNCPSFVGE